MNISIESVENGYIIEVDDRRWIAEDPSAVEDIVRELLEELEE